MTEQRITIPYSPRPQPLGVYCGAQSACIVYGYDEPSPAYRYGWKVISDLDREYRDWLGVDD